MFSVLWKLVDLELHFMGAQASSAHKTTATSHYTAAIDANINIYTLF